MRIAIGGIMHESNSFSPARTGLEGFSIQRGDEIIDWWRQTHHEIGGFIEGTAEHELVPILTAGATPSGTVTADTFDALTAELIDRLRATQPYDGLLLALHGAMVSEDYPDGDGEIARRARAALGANFPIVITHDYHANISQKLVDQATALVVYKTNPHLDQRARGVQAARILIATINRDVRPVQALVKPDMFLNIVHQYTSRDPMRAIMQAPKSWRNNRVFWPPMSPPVINMRMSPKWDRRRWWWSMATLIWPGKAPSNWPTCCGIAAIS